VAVNYRATSASVSTRTALSETQSGFDLGAGNATTGLMGGSGTLRLGSPVADATNTSDSAAAQGIASYISQTTSADKVTIQGGSRSALDRAGLSIQRPEIVGMFDFPPCFDTAGNPSPTAQLLDVQYQFKQAGYTTSTSLLLPLTGSLPDRSRSFASLATETLETFSGYKDVLNEFNKILVLFRIRETFLKTDLLASSILAVYEKFDDIYAASQKSLSSVLIDERGIDRDIVSSMSNSAIFLQALKESGLIIRYGSAGSSGRKYTETFDGYSAFPINQDSIAQYRAVVDALTDTTYSTTRDYSVITTSRISDLCSIISRNIIADTYDISAQASEIEGGPSSAITAILSDSLTSTEDVTSRQSAKMASAIISTTESGDLFLPYETAGVKKQNSSFRSGRDVFTSTVLTAASVEAGTTVPDEINRYSVQVLSAFLGEVTSRGASAAAAAGGASTTSSTMGPHLAQAILGYTLRDPGDSRRPGATTGSDPFEIYLLSACIQKFSDLADHLSSSDASFEEIFLLNLIGLSKENTVLFRLLARYALALFTETDYDASAEALVNYITISLQGQNSTSIVSRSIPATGEEQFLSYTGTSLESLLENTIVSRSSQNVINRLFDGIVDSLFDSLEQVLLTDLSRVDALRSGESRTRYLDNIGLESIYTVALAIFADLVTNSATIGARSRTGQSAASIFSQASRLNEISYYPTQLRVASIGCQALSSYTTDLGLIERLGIIRINTGSSSTTEDDIDVTSNARAFCAIYQEEFKRILKESLSLISLLSVPETVIYNLIFSESASSSSSSSASRTVVEPTAALTINRTNPLATVSRVTAVVPPEDRDFFVQNFTIDQLHTGVAMSKVLTKSSKDHPFFSISQVMNSYDLINLRSFVKLVGPKGNDFRNRILAIGIPAGMIDYLRNKSGVADYSSESSYQVYIRVYARNQRQDSDPVYIADYQFDSRIFVIAGQAEFEYLAQESRDIDTLFRSTPFKKASGTDLGSVDVEAYSDKQVLINHFNDYYCKSFLRASVGVDLNEHSFCFAAEIARRSPDVSREPLYASALGSIALKYPNNASEVSLYAEFLKQSVFFNYDGLMKRATYTKKFDRVFCIPVSLNQFAQGSEDQISMQDFFCSVIVGSPPEANPVAAIITTQTIETIASNASTANQALSAGMSVQDSARSQVEQNILDSVVGRGVSRSITQPPVSVVTNLQALRALEQTNIAENVFKPSVLSETRSAIESALAGFSQSVELFDAATLNSVNQGSLSSTVLVADVIQKSVASSAPISSPALLSTTTQRAVSAATATAASSVVSNSQQNVAASIASSAASSAASVASRVTSSAAAAAQSSVTTTVRSAATSSAATSRYRITSKVRS